MDTLNIIPTPDNLYWPLKEAIISAQLEKKAVVIHWSDNNHSILHPVWLRDNCCCKICLNQVTKEHLFDLRDISLDIQPISAGVDSDGALNIVWSEKNHTSRYNPGWLYANSINTENKPSNSAVLWTSSDFLEPPSFDAINNTVSDELLHDALITLKRYGMVRLRGLPINKEVVEDFALRIGPVRETHFDRIFDVVSQADSNTLANTSHGLAAHTDIPTRESPPGIQILHCRIAEAEGGNSTLTDGFKVAEDIGRNFPAHYRSLTKTKWCYANRAGPSDYRWEATTIGLNNEGELLEIRLLPFSRAPLIADYEAMDSIYAALICFIEKANSEEYQISFPFKAGDIIMFDNRRILHGRGEFYPNTGDRALRGTYIERDDVDSKIREFEQQIIKENTLGWTKKRAP